MLKSCHFKNFQSLKDKKIEFGPGVTTIIGSNDAGKSAFMRAMQLVCLNRLILSPDKYIRDGKNKLDLEVVFDNGRVRRVKGKSNLYFLNGKRLAAFGKNKVPEKVAELLNIGRENFQRQQDQHFWFSETPGEVSRKLNEMVSLGLIDKCLKNLNEGVREAKVDLQQHRDQIKQAKRDLESLEMVPLLHAKLRKLEKLDKLRRKTSRNAQELLSGVEAMQNARKGRKARRIALRAGKRVLQAGERLEKAKKRHTELMEALSELKRCRQTLKYKVPDLKPLIEFREKGDQLAERERHLRMVIEDLKLKEKQLWEKTGKLEKLKAKLAVLSKGRRCSKCGTLLSSPSSSVIFTCHKTPRSAERRKGKRGKT